MNPLFKGRHFPKEIILLCVRWYCKYGVSYRDLAEMMEERGVQVDHSTLYRWVQFYAAKLEKRVNFGRSNRGTSWRVDETYVRVGGKWMYLFRAIDKEGQLIDFMLSATRDIPAATRFLSRAVEGLRARERPVSITTDQAPTYPTAIEKLQVLGKLPMDLLHRTNKYLNNIIEADHGALKKLINPVRGFKTWRTAVTTIKGFEIVRMIRRGHVYRDRGIIGEVRFFNNLFGVYT